MEWSGKKEFGSSAETVLNTVSTLIDCYCNLSDHKIAYYMFDEMPQRGCLKLEHPIFGWKKYIVILCIFLS